MTSGYKTNEKSSVKTFLKHRGTKVARFNHANETFNFLLCPELTPKIKIKQIESLKNSSKSKKTISESISSKRKGTKSARLTFTSEKSNSFPCPDATPNIPEKQIESLIPKSKPRKTISGIISPKQKETKLVHRKHTKEISNSLPCLKVNPDIQVKQIESANRKSKSRKKHCERKSSTHKDTEVSHIKFYASYPASCEACGNKNVPYTELLTHIQLECVSSKLPESTVKSNTASDDNSTDSLTWNPKLLDLTTCNKQVSSSKTNCKTTTKRIRKRVMCKLCSDKFTSVMERNKHMALVHVDNKCKICNTFLTTKSQIDNHYKEHMVRSLICSICGKSFTRGSDLNKHTKVHLPPTHECNMCDYKSRFAANYRDHMKRHNNDRSFVCETCGKAFISRMDMAVHQKGHSDERPYSCTECDATFKHIQKCREHEKIIHAKNVNRQIHSCSVCNQRCATKRLLSDHMNIHTGDRPYACTACDKTFRSNSMLHKHRQVHADKTFSFPCDMCTKKCHTQFYLTRHKTMYHNKKELTFHCNICDKRFDSRAGVVSHKRVVHLIQGHTKLTDDLHLVSRNNLYTCNYCNHTFYAKSKLKQHIKQCAQ